jgi:predicted DCC family thiol-disulfide oxidoreductase YuxK
MERTVLLYDSHCGVCRWSVSKALRLARRAHLRAVALQDEEADRLLDYMDAATRMASWHLVAADGQVRSGGWAVGPLLRLIPGGRPVAALAETFPGTTDRVYRFLARHRTRLGRLVGEQRCPVDPWLMRD